MMGLLLERPDVDIYGSRVSAFQKACGGWGKSGENPAEEQCGIILVGV
jgi:hypothetical protein